MTERRLLVIGSQCDALGKLTFLDEATRELYAVMTDPDRGSCVPALEDKGLLINPTLTTAKEAIRQAYDRAARDEATLFMAYIGHGEHLGNDFYLLPRDSSPNQLTSDTAIHLTQLIKEQHLISSGRVDGLCVLLDACYSGTAAVSAAEQWVRDLQATLRFEVMTATSADRPAADGCFTRNMAKMLREGLADVPDGELRCWQLRERLERACPGQDPPQHPAYNQDATLWLAKNTRRSPLPWAQTALAPEIHRLTLTFQVTLNLAAVVSQSRNVPCLAVVAEAGMGKSALAAALAWPEKAPEMDLTGFVQAIVLLNEAQSPQEIARILSQQLERSVAGFHAAQLAYKRDTPFADQQRLGALEKQVIEPLRLMAPQKEVRIVVDALDRLAASSGEAVMEALNSLIAVPGVRLILTARPTTRLPEGAVVHTLALATKNELRCYLQERAIRPDRFEEILITAKGNWLVARVLADLLSDDPDTPLTSGQLALADAFEELMARCQATTNPDTQTVLVLLAAAGAGPVLPLPLLCAASENMGRSLTTARLRDELVRLRGLVSRSGAGTESEQVGLFHQALVDHVIARASAEGIKGKRALVEAIALLVPATTTAVDLSDPLQRYAFEKEANHLRAVGDNASALKALKSRLAASPRDNLRRWRSWQEGQVALQIGPDHPDTLTTRSNIASWTGKCGNPQEALKLFSELLPDQQRALGPDHPDTLITLSDIAGWTGDCGLRKEALNLFSELLADQQRVLGPDHPDTLSTRGNIATFTGECGDATKALKLFSELLPDLNRVVGADAQDTLTTRNNIALWTGDCGNPQEALKLSLELLADRERVLGHDHPNTLSTRGNIASWTGDCGNPQEALKLSLELLADQQRVLGHDHPDTLITRNNIAAWTGECGNAPDALRLLLELLPDRERVLGHDHPETFKTRNNIAYWTRECGNAVEALKLFSVLLLDQQRVLGPDHSETVNTRKWIKMLSPS